MELKHWVKQARLHAGMTGGRLGEAVGRTKANVSGWEKGDHEPSWTTIRKISEVTGYPVLNLLQDEVDAIDWHTLAMQIAMDHTEEDYVPILLDFLARVKRQREKMLQAIADRAKQHTPIVVKG